MEAYRDDDLDEPERLKDPLQWLAKQGTPTTSGVRFVQDSATIEIDDEDPYIIALERMTRSMRRQTKTGGFGYLNSSAGYDRKKELLAAKYIAKCFAERRATTKPFMITIDEYYKFEPENPSLIDKTMKVYDPEGEQIPAIVLSGFTDSDVFTEEVLKCVPNQDNAGLRDTRSAFGNQLFTFATTHLPLLLKEAKGSLKHMLKRIVRGKTGQKENAKLLLVTGLLLQDRQRWQNLWYEGSMQGMGPPLYIVAPGSFHDAMRRLNLTWTHGNNDYQMRAVLGANNRAPLEEGESANYYMQGLSAEEFEQRIKPLLEN